MVTNLGTPTNNTDAATKKYVDDKRCKFSNGTTNTSDVDISVYGFNNAVKFDSGAHSIGIDASAPPTVLVNKHSLETAGLIGINNFSPTVKNLFPHRFLMLKGTPTSHTVVYKDPLFNGGPTYRTATDSCELILYLNPTFRPVFTNTVSTFSYHRLNLSKFSCTVNVEGPDTKRAPNTSIGHGPAPTRHNNPMLVEVTFLKGGVVKSISKVLLGTTVSISKTMGWLTH